MKIRSLTLENVRKFGGKRVAIDGIGEGLSVISEANEFGKSTFFDALHALFFEKHGSTKKPIKSLQPHAGGGVRIAATVEVDGELYAVEKNFLARKGASVTDVAQDRVIARDDEAEAWIATHVNAANAGPAGLLWVRQGVLGLEPADSKPGDRETLAEARRDLLSSVAGEIDQVTGGRTMDRILKRCEEDLSKLATGTRQSPKGPWKEAVDDETALKAELDELGATCGELAEALDERRQVDDQMRRIGDPAAIAMRQADLDAARETARAAEEHAQQVAAAQSALTVAELRLKEAVRQRDAFATAIEQAEKAELDLQRAELGFETAKEDLGALRAAEGKARDAFASLESATKTFRDEMKLAERQRAAERAQADLVRAKSTRDEARKHVQSRSEAKARLAENPVTEANVAAVEAAQRELDRARSLAAARQVLVTVEYGGQNRILKDGAALPEGEVIVLSDGDLFYVPDVGAMRFSLPEVARDDVDAQMEAADHALRKTLADCDATTVDDVHARIDDRKREEAAVQLADNMLKALAPEGIDALDAALAEARARIAHAPEDPVRDADEVARDLDAANEAEQDGRQALETAKEKVMEARLAVERAGSARVTAEDARDRAERAAGPVAERSSRLSELAKEASAALREEKAQQDAVVALSKDAPDLETARANLDRAQGAFEGARKQLEELRERRAALSARIATRAEEGVEERRAEVADRLVDVSARAARYAAEVTSLRRLRDELHAARDHARDAYFEPIQEELRPLLRILHDDAHLDWESDSILPGALQRGGEIEDFDTLSGGTQEQIAILTRLAFARLFAKRGDHVPVILDDALVYSDDDRIVKMFTALNRVAANQQIIVFSCRQLAFAGLGGERPRILEASLAG
ncbi:MAG TPA: hypothetical protein DEO85_03210 [Maritimibacter sp.]|nr:hypothetical protein [Maritimibacter sp.]